MSSAYLLEHIVIEYLRIYAYSVYAVLLGDFQLFFVNRVRSAALKSILFKTLYISILGNRVQKYT